VKLDRLITRKNIVNCEKEAGCETQAGREEKGAPTKGDCLELQHAPDMGLRGFKATNQGCSGAQLIEVK